MLFKSTWRDLLEREGFIEILREAIASENTIIGELYPLLKEAAQREGFTEEDFLLLFITLCDYMGGTMVYFPKGRKLQQVIVRQSVISDFNGNNHAEVARRHGLSVQQVYRYLAKTEAINNQIQDDLNKYRPYLSGNNRNDGTQ